MSTQTTELGTPVRQPRVSIDSILCNVSAIAFDSIACTYTSTTDVYKLYTGGVAGTLVETITVTYSDSSKQQVTSIVKVTA
jgi:hypothetical protein